MSSPATPSLPSSINRLSQHLRREVVPILGRIPAYGRLIYALATERTLTARQKTALFLAIGYQVSPVDLVPGFIPVLGQLDDVLVMLWGIRKTLDALTPERAAEVLESIPLTRAQLEADIGAVRRVLSELIGRSVRSAGRGVYGALRAGVTAGAYLGYLTYFLVKKRRQTGRRAR